MKIKRLLLTLALAAALIPGLVRPAAALSETDVIKQLLAYYCHYQEAAETDIARLLEQLEAENPDSARAWREILEVWRWSVEDLEVNWDVLPDGLPQDDSLCIVNFADALNCLLNLLSQPVSLCRRHAGRSILRGHHAVIHRVRHAGCIVRLRVHRRGHLRRC